MVIIDKFKQVVLNNSLLDIHKIEKIESNLSYLEQVKLGCYAGGMSFCSKPLFAIAALAITAITYSYNYLFYLTQSKEKNHPGENSFLQNVVVLPILTEVFFRGLIQNSLRQIQEAVKSLSTPSQSGSKIITSPIGTILAPNTLQALYTAQQSYLQAAFIALYPTGSILHFITGDKICAPIAAHITSSFIAYTICNMYKLFTFVFLA